MLVSLLSPAPGRAFAGVGEGLVASDSLNPARFGRPRGQGPTRHLYLANCGRARGDHPEAVLEALQLAAGPGVEIQSLHIGDEGVSFASFMTPGEAEQARKGVAAAGLRWVVRFAEHADEPGGGSNGLSLPPSVASTASVEVPGLEVYLDFVVEREAQDLMAAIDDRPWDTTIKRRVQHYGYAFDYAQLAIAQERPQPLPAFCDGVVRRLEETGVLTHPVDQVTINEYVPGVGIASHVDAHSAFEDGVGILSLGSGIVMDFRKPRPGANGKTSVGKHHRLAPPPADLEATAPLKSVWLPANSLIVLRSEARYAWQHAIAWRKTDCLSEGEAMPRGRRVSLTLRKARFLPCECCWPAFCDAQNPEAHNLPTHLSSVNPQTVASKAATLSERHSPPDA